VKTTHHNYDDDDDDDDDHDDDAGEDDDVLVLHLLSDTVNMLTNILFFYGVRQCFVFSTYRACSCCLTP